jgi:selenium metabolism protein YedF
MATELTVDARGLACPQPVLETKRVLEEGSYREITVQVDNSAAKENVSRFARNQGCTVDVSETGSEEYAITIARTGEAVATAYREDLLPCPVPETSARKRLAVYVASNCMGSGSDELGVKLMRGFLRTLIDSPPLPWRIVLINSGVKLGTIDEEAVDAISMLQDRGVEVLSCGTCLEHFQLEDKLRVGKVTNMYEVIETLNQASKVISPD